ncbi:MAG: aldehyde dehydrogenase family protein, partial [Nitrospira sp. CG24D]
DAASLRPEPIPFYAEMSSINPIFLLPAALRARAEAIAQGFVGSLVQGVGQFCTNPGLVLGVEGPDLDHFIAVTSAALASQQAATILTPGIHAAYVKGTGSLENNAAVSLAARGIVAEGPNCATPALLVTDAASFMADARLGDEVFGPSSLIVKCRDIDEMILLAESLEGQLTATLHIDPRDLAMARRLLPVLERKAGRILANGWPTGVEVGHATVHGGPFPATSDSRTTSVGALAIRRFLRPVAYQNLPADLLPPVLR